MKTVDDLPRVDPKGSLHEVESCAMKDGGNTDVTILVITLLCVVREVTKDVLEKHRTAL